MYKVIEKRISLISIAAYVSRGCCDSVDTDINGILPKVIQRVYSATIDFEVRNTSEINLSEL